MIEEQARVISVEQGHAWVETQRRSTCGSCAANKGCGTSVIAKMVGNRRSRVRAIDPVGVRLGDEVVVGIEEAALVRGSLAVYTVPLITLLVGALLARWLWPAAGEPVVVLSGLAGLAAGLVWLRLFAGRVSSDPRYQPVILRRLHSLHPRANGVLAP
ncbi:SoxR reducing system RseC family protein [Thioalkalivibrio sulfidiphilus]|uniref:Positive regulator of sigma E, RseC/MucC n=1 Tax=Thioalkalivibrio sulfidiphilus (strain HL-EbGR7) TaxID=396588 RepID=B8GPK5_THISH|nr:SoxR reducing system RseC family protein [Thioalkalivibrio sulfidiphilus]ACL72172.1 positive regulator of sigma E, RseC/MucC [Thioalkalivibrio sulfidiphilus HL-EbGr7]